MNNISRLFKEERKRKKKVRQPSFLPVSQAGLMCAFTAGIDLLMELQLMQLSSNRGYIVEATIAFDNFSVRNPNGQFHGAIPLSFIFGDIYESSSGAASTLQHLRCSRHYWSWQFTAFMWLAWMSFDIVEKSSAWGFVSEPKVQTWDHSANTFSRLRISDCSRLIKCDVDTGNLWRPTFPSTQDYKSMKTLLSKTYCPGCQLNQSNSPKRQ